MYRMFICADLVAFGYIARDANGCTTDLIAQRVIFYKASSACALINENRKILCPLPNL